MKILASAVVALALIAGIAAPASAFTVVYPAQQR